MVLAVAAACCLVALASGLSHDHAHAHGSASKAGPVDKVIDMLQTNKMKVMSDLEAEQKEMAQYSSFCDTEQGAKNMAIALAKRKMEDLDATVQDSKSQIKGLDDEIAELGIAMAAKEQEMAAADKVRSAEHEDFVAAEKELVGSLDEMDKSIVIVKREMASQSSLVQVGSGQLLRKPNMQAVVRSLSSIVDAFWLDHGNKQYLKGLLQQSQKAGDASGAEESDTESDDLRLTHKSSQEPGEKKEAGLLGILMDMKEKAQVTLSNARAAEMKAAFNFAMMKQSLQDAQGLSKKKTSDATSTKAVLAEEAGKAEGELVETRKTKIADAAYLKTLTTECEETATAWEERQKSATDEIGAIDKAKEILQARVKAILQLSIDGGSDAQDGEGDSALSGDEKTAERAAGIAQYDDDTAAALRARLVQHIKNIGKQFHSYVMMEMVSAAATDPFDKIRGLIEDMITKLVAEANEEASQKEFCDEEKGKSNEARDELSTKIDKTTARLDRATSESSQLKDTITELQSELAEIEKATGEAMKLRNEEHANYLKASKDYKDAAAAVEDAIGVLKSFYASALVQTHARKVKNAAGGASRTAAPPKFGSEGDASTTVISLLEVSAEDFTRLNAIEESKEMEAQAEYLKLVMYGKVATMSKTYEMKAADSQIKQIEVAVRGYKEDNAMQNQELDAVMAYLEKLRPQCETKVMTYEEKKARREAEIEGLKQALGIIEGGAALVQAPRVLRGVTAKKLF